MSTKSVNTECKNLTASELEQDTGWQAIYAQSFPPDEIESFKDVIVPGVRDKAMSALCVRDNDQTMAMAAVHHLYDNDLGFLVYIAAKPGERGKATAQRCFNIL